MVIGDEAHLFKAQTLKRYSRENEEYCFIRISTTGTLDGSEVHRLQLEGLFGFKSYIISRTDRRGNY